MGLAATVVKSYPCDCYCYGACPDPLVIPAGGLVLIEAVCPREPVYELVYDDLEDPVLVTSSLFCAPCTASAREHDKAGEIRSIRMIPA